MTLWDLFELIERSSSTVEAIRAFALGECAPGGVCPPDPDFLPLAYWHSVWATRLRRRQPSGRIDGMEKTVQAFATHEGSAQCIYLLRPERIVLLWFSPERELRACVAYTPQSNIDGGGTGGDFRPAIQ